VRAFVQVGLQCLPNVPDLPINSSGRKGGVYAK
jgi:hypothetical protein